MIVSLETEVKGKHLLFETFKETCLETVAHCWTCEHLCSNILLNCSVRVSKLCPERRISPASPNDTIFTLSYVLKVFEFDLRYGKTE